MSFVLLANAAEYDLSAWRDYGDHEPPPIETIAQSLSLINRFTGHTWRAYSVAEHSLLASDIAAERYNATPVVRLACLMHDAHECVTGDVSTPVKQMLGDAWDDFEARIAARLRRHWKLSVVFAAQRATIRACDLAALATERRDLLPFQRGRNLPWPALDTPGREVKPHDGIDLHDYSGISAAYWRDKFIGRYCDLRDAVADQLAAIPAREARP